MSKIKQAIERKFPRYVVTDHGFHNVEVSHITTRTFVVCCEDIDSASNLMQERNELIDKLIEAAELLAEAQRTLQL